MELHADHPSGPNHRRKPDACVLRRGPDDVSIHWTADEAVRVVGRPEPGTGQEGVLALHPVPSHVGDAGRLEPHHPSGNHAEPAARALLALLEEELHPEADPQTGGPTEEPLPDRLACLGEEGARRRVRADAGEDQHRRRETGLGSRLQARLAARRDQRLQERVDVPHPRVEDRHPHRSTSRSADSSRSIWSHGPTPIAEGVTDAGERPEHPDLDAPRTSSAWPSGRRVGHRNAEEVCRRGQRTEPERPERDAQPLPDSQRLPRRARRTQARSSRERRQCRALAERVHLVGAARPSPAPGPPRARPSP